MFGLINWLKDVETWWHLKRGRGIERLASNDISSISTGQKKKECSFDGPFLIMFKDMRRAFVCAVSLNGSKMPNI